MTVTVKIDDIAASAASVIAMAGDNVLMSPVSMMMIHNPATVAFGDHKLFVMSWNEIVEHQADYQERWQENIKGDDVLLRYKTKLVMKHAAAGPIKGFDPKLMMAVMDHITVFEDGRLQLKFYDETEFGVETE